MRLSVRPLRGERGFTLVEIMVVVVILGILAAIVMPKLLGRPEEARITQVKTQIRGIEQALGMFKLDNGFYPSTEQGLEALVHKPSSGRMPLRYAENAYLPKVPNDPWGSEYLYIAPGVHGEYDLYSYGPDKQPGGEGQDADIGNWDLE